MTLLLAFVCGIVAFTQRNIPFFIIIVVIEFFILVATKHDKDLIETYTINSQGFWMGRELIYPRENMSRFAMTDHNEEIKINTNFELILESNRMSPNRCRVLIPYSQGLAVRNFILENWQLPEFEYSLGMGELVKRIIGL